MPSNKLSFIKLLLKHPRYAAHLFSKKIGFFKRYKWIQSDIDKNDRVPPPLVYELMLTLKCNLRCHMCMLWGDVGWCGTIGGGKIADELDIEIIRKILRTAKMNKPSFILHGGEPFLHSQFREIVQLLKEHRCFSTVITNGTMLDKFQDIFIRDNFLDLLISLDGLEKENDAIRGEGVFKKVTNNIRFLKSLKYPLYIGIQYTILPQNVGIMYEFCKKMVDLGVDWILLNPCWFISEEQKSAYEKFMIENFDISPKTHLGYFSRYNLNIDEFVRQYNKIKSDKWPIRISCYLKNPAEDIYAYMNNPRALTINALCYKQWLRMDVTPQGKVTPCIRYPDLIFGDLNIDNVETIWNSRDFARFRKIIRKKVLPICNKCNCLYLYDAKRTYL